MLRKLVFTLLTVILVSSVWISAGSGSYLFIISDLEFFPGETIHADITITSAGLGYQNLLVLSGSDTALAHEEIFVPDQQNTISLDYAETNR